MIKFHQILITKFSSYRSIFIPKEKLECKFSKSSGPGGQHVNKTNSKAEIRFNLQTADWLSEDQKKKFLRLYPNYVNKEGEIILTSQFTREQSKNLEDAIDKLREMIFECSKPDKTTFTIPPPSQYRIEQRIQFKRQRSDVKKTRNIK
ncbi:unnamed protein product [Paramecium primaurelia]|uniref:Prokaryotic-type class I peptide chain release factors domain-containing protein n=1 Tax=Paramecium primaurelia TaxID=5886 RepID=A0A8S1KS11_PARPR|nr:unnamed protein product [Paramecium primaurelia]